MAARINSNERQKVNIAHVARMANVSKMTVSRVINNADNVALATREKIQQVIDQLHYQPSPMARGLATNTTNIIGMLTYDQGDSGFFYNMIIGAQQAAKQAGYDLLIFSKPEKKSGFGSQRLGLIDGMLCLGNIYDNDTIELIDASQLPYVVIGKRNWRKVSPFTYAADYRKGFYKVTNYLMNMGHRCIAMLGGRRNFEADTEKYVGFQQALFDAGIPYNPAMTLYDDEMENIMNVLTAFSPTALIVEGPSALLRTLLAIKELSLSIPKDVSLICTQLVLDTHTIFSLTGIYDLTRVEVPLRSLGTHGMQLLIRMLQGEQDLPRENMIPVEFYEGESCAPPRI